MIIYVGFINQMTEPVVVLSVDERIYIYIFLQIRNKPTWQLGFISICQLVSFDEKSIEL